ncbi:E3 ubiquitin-protein ligase DCST1 [Brachyistius frenatus]|uniref:E3 ubiquitin-protein ligase DCST1 n=1 Tax=Brachyistius frenatus TaxID=100188 RepID=UPI0037E8E24A
MKFTPSAPRRAVHRLLLALIPPVIQRFLFSQSEEFPVAHLVVRALCGAVSGAVLFLAIARNLPLTVDLKLAAGCLFVALCVAGGVWSSSFRCAVLLVFPSMLGSRGRAYLMLLILSVLYTGPVSNIRQNVETAALSLSCNLDLQVRHSRLLWRQAITPFILITQGLTDDKAGFQSEAQSVSIGFQDIRDEVVVQYGYDGFGRQPGGGNNTQKQFTTKTKMQCDSVVNEGVQRCADWFSSKWAKCMKAIPVPVINHILCVSMKFHFLCDIMRVMTPWCREQIPVEGNFGQMFDQLNVSVDLLSREFSTEVHLQEQQVLSGALLDEDFTDSVRRSLQKLMTTTEQVMKILQLLMSFTFITIFTQAFVYLRRYMKDIYFDNIYITSYFRQIDARRKTAGKCCLLPLNKSERSRFIEPCSLKVHPAELNDMMSGVFQVLSVSLLTVFLLTVDFSLFHVLDIISRHSFTQFNVTSSHQVGIKVMGDSMMARLLRTTVSAFNSSSSLGIHSDNQECVSPPSSLPAAVYISCVCCVLLVALFSCLQVYTNRLRRVIAASYNPKREKKRILFLYNLQINKRISSTDRKRIISGGQRRTVIGCQPSDQQLVQSQPSDQQLVQSQPSDQQLVQSQPSDQQLVQSQPSDQQLSKNRILPQPDDVCVNSSYKLGRSGVPPLMSRSRASLLGPTEPSGVQTNSTDDNRPGLPGADGGFPRSYAETGPDRWTVLAALHIINTELPATPPPVVRYRRSLCGSDRERKRHGVSPRHGEVTGRTCLTYSGLQQPVAGCR